MLGHFLSCQDGVFLVGKSLPQPVGVFCTRLEPPNCYVPENQFLEGGDGRIFINAGWRVARDARPHLKRRVPSGFLIVKYFDAVKSCECMWIARISGADLTQMVIMEDQKQFQERKKLYENSLREVLAIHNGIDVIFLEVQMKLLC